MRRCTICGQLIAPGDSVVTRANGTDAHRRCRDVLEAAAKVADVEGALFLASSKRCDAAGNTTGGALDAGGAAAAKSIAAAIRALAAPEVVHDGPCPIHDPAPKGEDPKKCARCWGTDDWGPHDKWCPKYAQPQRTPEGESK